MALELSFVIPYGGDTVAIVAQAAGTAPTGGFDQLVIINNLTGTPTLFRNGTAVTTYGPIWNDGTGADFRGGPPIQSNAMVAYYLSGGPVLASDVMTITIPANFVNGSSPAYTAATVTNYTGKIEGPFGHMPGLNGTPTTGAGCNLGQPSIDYQTANYLPWNQLFRGSGWGGVAGATYDQFGYPISWPAASGFHNRFYGPSGSNDLDNRGWPNEIGVWSLIWSDAAIGTTGLTTTVTPVMGGDSPNGTLSIGTPSVVGNVTILPFTVGYNTSSPSSWYTDLALNVSAPANNLGGTDGLAHWALGKGPFVVPPNSADGTQASAALLNQLLSNPYKINQNVRAQLTGGGNVASHLRAMESILGSGNQNNGIYKIDMPDARAASWEFFPTLRTVTTTFNFVRFLNTNPAKGSVASGGDGTYNWTPSTKVYGPQSDFVLSDGVTTPVTATLTNGSINCTITGAFPAIMAGGVVSGTGIAAGTRLAYFNAATGAAVLDTPATASGSQSLTVANPKYAPLAAADDGNFFANGYGPQNWGVVELRSTTPHGLTTGQVPTNNGGTNHNAIALTNVVGNVDPQYPQGPLYVTGPYTVALGFSVASTGGSTVQTVAQTTEYNFTSTGGWVAQVIVPFDNVSCLPPEALVAMCADLGCPRAWVNLPGWGTDELYTQIGTRCASVANSTIEVDLERGDEPWNGGAPFYQFLLGNIARQNLYGYYPNGTVVSSYLTTSSAVPMSTFGFNGVGGNTLLSGHMRDVFVAAWTAGGKSAGKVKHILGCQWNGPVVAQNVLGAAQQWGVPADRITIAPYVETPQATSIVNAMNASGGNMSLGAINDYIRLYWFCDYAIQSQYQQHQALIQAWGQPTQSINNNGAITTALSGSSSLFAGGYRIWATWLDTSGNETTVGASDSGGISLPANNYSFFVPVPAVPSWVKSINLYIINSSSAPPSASAKFGNFPLVSNPIGTQIRIGALGTGGPPPTTNGVPSSSAGTPPILVSYEGGDDVSVPSSVTNFKALTHDVHAHPSRWLAVYTWYMTTQIGCQWAPGSGMAFVTWFAGWAGPGYVLGAEFNSWYDWIIYNGPGQPAGRGLSNWYATNAPGSTGPGDGQDHNGGWPSAIAPPGAQVRNERPGGYGLQQWIAGGTSPTPTPTPTATTAARRFVSRRG